MSDDRIQPFDGLVRWLADDPGVNTSMPPGPPADDGHDSATPDHGVKRDETRRSARRGMRAAALVAPWLVVLAVLAAPARTSGTSPRRTGQPAVHVAPSPADDWSPEPANAPREPDDTFTDSAARATPPVPAGIAAAAVRLVRDAVTGRRAGATAAMDVAVPEPPQPLDSDQWLVRVQAVVLRGDARRWRSATHEVWAVPVGLRAGQAIGLDHPWRVATETPRITPGDWAATAVDDDAVRAALHAVGAQPAQELGAQQHPTIAHVIRVRVADAERTRRVWLTTEPTMRVLGAPRTTAAPMEGATP
jgi:hypothetical protein